MKYAVTNKTTIISALLAATALASSPALAQVEDSSAETEVSEEQNPVAEDQAAAPAEPAVAEDQAAAPDAPANEAQSGAFDIVVTAQRRSQRLHEVPITVVARSGSELAKAGVSNIRDLSRIVPGLSYTSQGPFAQPNIRGVTTTLTQAGSDSPIAIYLDGLYQPSQVGNLFDLPDVERIEVLKGPQGTLFGRNATGGAISVVTKTPSFDTEGSLTVSDGLYFGKNVKTSNHFTASGYVSAPIVSDLLAASLAGYYEHVDGYMTDELRDGRSGRIESYVVRGKLLFEPAPGLKFTLGGYFGKRDDAAGASLAALNGVSVATQYPDAVLPSGPWRVASELANSAGTTSVKNRGLSLKGEIDVGDAGTLTSLTGYTYVNGRVVAEVDGAYSPSCVAVFACITPYVLDYGPSKTLQQELTFASRDLGGFNFVAGAFLYRDSSDIGTEVNPPLVDGRPAGPAPYFTHANVKTRAYAGFGEFTWNATDALHLTAGLRYSWEKKKGVGSIIGGPAFDFGNAPSWDSWTPRLSVRYDISNNSNVYATFSKGFKSGALESVNLTDDVANPETLTSYELGYKYSSRNAQLNLSAFYYDYKDLQVQFFIGLATRLGNAANAKIYGFDVDGSIELLDGLDLRAAASWIPKAEYTDFANGVAFDFPMTPTGLQQVVVNASNTRIIRTPKLTGNLSLNYERETDIGLWDANASVSYSSAFRWELLGRVKTEEYATLGAQVGFTPAGSNLRIGVYGRNLTNKAYITATTLSAQADTAAYAPPREVGVTLGYKF